ncbi:UDP-3-O-(3-hydroxymyristoyl)glucosamine N-acyltransferase [soil metagenome]
MKFPSPVSLQWLASFVNAELIGDTSKSAGGINEIHNVNDGDLAFVDHPKYYEKCLNSAASFIIINKKTEIPAGKALLITDNPFEAYLKIVKHFSPFVPATTMISDSANIHTSSVIMPNVFIGHNVSIGANCIIHPNVSIYDNCIIGNNVVIHSGTVVGSDAFYFNTKKDRENWYKKMDSCGRVVIEDDVEIGANCTIDRGVSADTRIGKGSKLDNLIHLGHEVVTGSNCLIASQVGIAGCTILGNGVTIWGQAGLNKTLTIGDNAMIMGQTGVTGNLEGGKAYWGTPAIDAMQKLREPVWMKRLPEMWEKLKNLSERSEKK